MTTRIAFTNIERKDLIRSDVKQIGFTDHGYVVLTGEGNKVLGVFPPHAIAAAYHDEQLVTEVKGTLISA